MCTLLVVLPVEADLKSSDSFSIELINTSFNNAFAIANNVDPSTGSITLTLPSVPVGYAPFVLAPA